MRLYKIFIWKVHKKKLLYKWSTDISGKEISFYDVLRIQIHSFKSHQETVTTGEDVLQQRSSFILL